MIDKETKDKTAEKLKETDEEEGESSGDDGAPTIINLQKRKGDVEPTRYGDWELNGRCIDF